MSTTISTKFSEMDFETKYDESKDADFCPRQESIEVAHNLLSDGKDSLDAEDMPTAIQELSDACDIFASVFGESAPECAEAYYFYGKALLGMSRIESLVLDNAFEGVYIVEDSTEGDQVEGTDALTKAEKLEVEDSVADAFEDNYEEHDRVARAHVLEESEGSEASESEDSEESETETEESEDEEISADVEKVEEQEEVGHLEMAWEVLELARLGWSKMSKSSTGDMKKEVDANLAEVHLALGEVAMDSSNYSQSHEDFQACISLKKSVLPAEARSLAESFYQLGVSQAMSGKFPESEASLMAAISVLEARAKNHVEEREELGEVVAEIREELEEHKVMQKEGTHYGAGGKLHQSSMSVSGLKHSGPQTVGSA